MLAFTVAVSLGTGFLFGIVPAWQATRTDVNTALKDASHATASRHKMWLGKGLVTVGIGGALWLAHFLSAMLYGLKPTDPLTLASAGSLLMVVAILAGFGPARRASRVGPIRALRHE